MFSIMTMNEQHHDSPGIDDHHKRRNGAPNEEHAPVANRADDTTAWRHLRVIATAVQHG
jgi:hypothetical protein